MLAARSGYAEVIRRLLVQGAKPGIRNSNGKTARKVAEQASHEQVLAAFDEYAASKGGWLDFF